MKKMKQQTKRMCEVCPGPKKKTSQMFCLQCEQSFCKSCSNYHSKIKATSSHELLHLNELQDYVDVRKKMCSVFCDKHTDKQIELFCMEDKMPICFQCCFLDHRSHNCKEIKDIVAEYRDVERQRVIQIAIADADRNLSGLDSRKCCFFDQVKNVETKICQEADQKIQMIEIHKRKLIADLHDIKTNHEQEINRLTQDITRAKSLLTQYTNHCDELLKDGSDIAICQEADSFQRQSEELLKVKSLENSLKNLCVFNIIYSPSSLAFYGIKSILGQIEIGESGVLDESNDRSVLLVTPRVTDDPQLLVTLNKPPTYSDGEPRCVTGVAMLDNNLYVVYRKHNRIEVFNCEDHFKKVKGIRVAKLERSLDMVSCIKTAHLYISEYNSGAILRVDVKTGDCGVFIEHEYSDPRLTLVEDGLCMRSHDSLLIYDIRTGKMMRNIPYTEDMKMHGVKHIVESNRASFIISQGYNSTVSEIDCEGRVVRMFIGKDLKLQCDYLALDSVGRVIVADWNSDVVFLLDEHLKFVKILFDKERLDNSRPNRLNYNKTNNRLAVGLGNGQVKIFDCNAY